MTASNKPKVLLQFDTDKHASAFDAMVAIDAGVDQLLQYGNVNAEEIRSLVHGAMYTRGPQDLHRTAIFVGGSNVGHGESLVQSIVESFQPPFRVSVMLDSSGANSTAAAAVLSAQKHVELKGKKTVVLGATGPVGQRVCRLLANAGSSVFVGSRSYDRSQEVIAELVLADVDPKSLVPLSSDDDGELQAALNLSCAVVACGAAGVKLISEEQLRKADSLEVAIDLNAVAPSGIEGIGLFDSGVQRGDRIDYGAIGVGGLKMKIHKASIASLFESNSAVIDCQQMLTIGHDILARTGS